MSRECRIKTGSLLCAVAVAALFAGPADAIYKCTTAKGVVYQDRPCREGNESDVSIVIPTGEVAPKSTVADSDASANAPRGDNASGAAKPGRPQSEDPASVSRPADRKSGDASANGGRKDARTTTENTVSPPSAEQARKTDPTAKYFATEGFGPGNETPTQMNCESPTGEKRVFYLSNGKLTSI